MLEKLFESFSQLIEAFKNNVTLLFLLVVTLLMLYPFISGITPIDLNTYITLCTLLIVASIVVISIAQSGDKKGAKFKQYLFDVVSSENIKLKQDFFKKIDDLEKSIEETRNLIAPTIVLLRTNRKDLDIYGVKLFNAKREVFIMALTGESFTKEIEKYKQEFISLLFNQNIRIRLLLLNPHDIDIGINLQEKPSVTISLKESEQSLVSFWITRSKADQRPLSGLKAQVEYVKKFWQDFEKEFKEKVYREQEKNPSFNIKGNLKIKYHEYMPYYAYFQADDDILIGLYLNNKPGRDSPTLESINDPAFRETLEEDFKEMNRNKDLEILVQITPYQFDA